MSASHQAFERFVRTGRTGTDAPQKPEFSIPDQYLEQVTRKSGLTEETCAELLIMGWTYKEELNKPPVWVHPMATVLEFPLI